MRVKIRVVANAGKRRVIDEGGVLRVYVSEPAIDGRANRAVVELLAEHFNVCKSKVKIVRGEFSREKIIDIDLN